MTTEPSPTADATRLTELDRTSPTANIPGTLVAYGVMSKPSVPPVSMNPFLSSLTVPKSQPVFGSAPIITKTLPMGFAVKSPDRRLDQVTPSSEDPPSSFTISESVYSVMRDELSMREMRYCDIVLARDLPRTM